MESGSPPPTFCSLPWDGNLASLDVHTCEPASSASGFRVPQTVSSPPSQLGLQVRTRSSARHRTVSNQLSTSQSRLAQRIQPRRQLRRRAVNHDHVPRRGGVPDVRGDDNLGHRKGEAPNMQGDKFACPFFRVEPSRHMECMNLKLTRVRDVKQHINRRHARTASYCPICYATFDSMASRDSHTQLRECEPREPTAVDPVDGVSLETQEVLKQRVDRSLPAIDQWNDMWDILFPGKPRPLTPYLGSTVEESLVMVRGVLEKEGRQMIPELLDDKSLARNGDLYVLDILDTAIVRIGQRFRSTGGEICSNDNSPTRQSSGRRPLSGSASMPVAATEPADQGSEGRQSLFSQMELPAWDTLSFSQSSTLEENEMEVAQVSSPSGNESAAGGTSHSFQAYLSDENPFVYLA
ncbi:hypothetical protein QBC34DRAFT_348432 [Podospora aff. communis PSN243]|uniref:C2H2-type domain-containing protein n=1 Tax=Podospora aff. communis PSN243 TaxID=3040156 RepID=A0AAV9GPW2_9PEZI|nr:hypothetical protein QBC34DRAFT_348432 [Podospora aff. communis PSN243]